MEYWLDLFTPATWEEFLAINSSVTGFRESRRNICSNVATGDIFICYVAGVQRWVGALKVLGQSTHGSGLGRLEGFPVRFDVTPLVVLEPEFGIPMVDLLGKVDFYDAPSTKGGHKGFLRASPTKFKLEADGKLIHQMLEACKSTPERKPLNKTELQRARLYNVSFLSEQGEKTVPVSIPEKEPSKGGPSETNPTIEDKATTRHTEFQHFLATLGADLGYDVWIARNDRSRMWRQAVLGELPRVVSTMPLQFNDATTKTIELIDLLWLKGNSIVAAFEIECTTSVYSGLLRMSDLLALQPNLEIRLFLVAPDERRNKVQQEITRPTFSLRDKPLCEICGFLSFDNLAEKVKNIRDMGLIASLRPEFLESVAEYFRSSAGGR